MPGLSTTRGFSLLELVIALGLTLVVTAAVFDLIGQSLRRFGAEPDAADLQQRSRVVVDVLHRDLLTAAAVIPYRAAGASPDPPGTFRDDVVTIVSEREDGEDSTRTYYIRQVAASGASQLMRAEGGGGDAPVVDGVTSISFAYFGEPAGGGDLVPIGGSELRDGPWCQRAPGGEPFDADLLRVRRIGVRVFMKASASALSFDVAPRNLNEGR